MDQSPHSGALGKARGKGQRRPRKLKGGPGQVPVPPMSLGQNPMGQGQPGMPGMQGVPPNPQMSHMTGYGQGPATMQQGQQFGGNPTQQQWYNQQQQQPQGYYPQQMANGNINYLKTIHFKKHFVYFPVNRFERPQINQSKQALSNMLRQRHPANQFMGPAGQSPAGPGPQAGYGPIQRQFPRQALRQQHPAAMQTNQVFFNSSS